jgi:polysaccharide biosynthesis/export protein
MKQLVYAALGAGLLGVSTSHRLVAQNPEAQLQQALQQQPGLVDVIRQRIQQSGLTADQVRARLSASGYPTNLLDAYLGQALPGAALPAASAQELAAVQALGLAPAETGGLPLDTGLFQRRGVTPAPPSAVFGVDAFRRSTTQFLPTLSGPVPPDYKLGAGDVLVLILTGDVELAYTLQVTREGFILIPQVGQVFVSNLTLASLRDVLYSRLGRVYSGVKRGPNATTRFDMSVANVRVNQIYVVGEVAQPGAYQISSFGTALTGLYAAGGVTERANMRRIEIQRSAKTVGTLDLYDYLLRGDTRNDVRLETGDVVFVPVHGTRVQITGAVVRPAIYELDQRETLLDLVHSAGGFRADAALRRIAVHRILPAAQRGPGPTARAVVDVSLTPAATLPGGSRNPGAGKRDGEDPTNGVVIPSVVLQDGDSVDVDSVRPLDQGYFVSITGMVRKPGMYPWRPGITLRDLVALGRGPVVGAYLKEAEVARMPEDRTQGQLATTLRVPMDSTYLFERDSSGRYVGPPGLPYPASGAPEVALAPYDNVLILRQPDFDFQRTVTIAGQVRFPGVYSLRAKSDRLADLIERAGGLTPQAYPDGIRFVRPTNASGRINIDVTKALQQRNSRDNVILQPGDSVFIPEFLASVKVSGAVTSPGSVLWKRGEDLAFYIDGAGGFTYLADKKRVTVQFANGEVQPKKAGPKPGPGSEVFVPVRDTTHRQNYAALVGSIAQILASTVAIVVVVTRK